MWSIGRPGSVAVKVATDTAPTPPPHQWVLFDHSRFTPVNEESSGLLAGCLSGHDHDAGVVGLPACSAQHGGVSAGAVLRVEGSVESPSGSSGAGASVHETVGEPLDCVENFEIHVGGETGRDRGRIMADPVRY